MATKREALEELARRKVQQGEYAQVIDGIRGELFAQQLAVVDDPERDKAVLCTRRAGKTNIWPRYAVIECLRTRGALVRIWSIARLRAKELQWKEILDVCARHRVKVKSHETELRITFENGSEIRLVGADKDKEAQKKRGDKTTLEIVLECQSFGNFLRKLVEEVIEPSLFDMRGTKVLEGTPGVVQAGFWYYVTGDNHHRTRWLSEGMLVRASSDEEAVQVGAKWSCHRWSLLDNPKLPNARTAREDLARLKAKRGWGDDNPTYLREYRAQWVTDKSSLYYRFDRTRNTYKLEDVKPWGPGWYHCLGWDIGFNDAMALVVWAWRDYDDNIYEAASWSEAENAGRVNVVKKIHEFEERFNIEWKVADTGGAGRLFVEEIQAREGLSFEAAKKTEKYHHVTLMNDDFLTGRIKCLEGSSYSQCIAALPKDPDWEPESGSPPKEDPRFPNHEADAGLYAWRRVSSYLATEAPKKKVKPGEAGYVDEQEAELLGRMEGNSEGKEWWEPEVDEPEDFG